MTDITVIEGQLTAARGGRRPAPTSRAGGVQCRAPPLESPPMASLQEIQDRAQAFLRQLEQLKESL